MNSRVLNLLRDPAQMKTSDLDLMRREISNYPYVQSVRALYLMALHRFAPEEYKKELSVTAGYTTNKKILYNLVNAGKSPQDVEARIDLPKQISAQQDSAQPVISDSAPSEAIVVGKEVAETTADIPQLPPPHISAPMESSFPKGRNRIAEIDEAETGEDQDLPVEEIPTNVPSENADHRELPPEEHPTREKETEQQEDASMTSDPEILQEIVKSQTEDDTPDAADIEEQLNVLESEGDAEALKENPETAVKLAEMKASDTAPEESVLKPGSRNRILFDDEEDFVVPEFHKTEQKELDIEPAQKDAPLPSAPPASTGFSNVNVEPSKENRSADPYSSLRLSGLPNFTTTVTGALPAEVTEKAAEERAEPQAPQHEDETADESWTPMTFESSEPDALVDAIIPEEDETPKPSEEQPISEAEIAPHETEEIPVINFSFFGNAAPTETAGSTDKEGDEQTQDIPATEEKPEKSSNVSGFINTWQNWLKISDDVRPEAKKAKVIDEFIEKNPKISTLKEDTDYVVKDRGNDISHLMTDTLAKLYVEQKYYSKALNAYEVLKTKFPDKAEEYDKVIAEIKEMRQGNNFKP